MASRRRAVPWLLAVAVLLSGCVATSPPDEAGTQETQDVPRDAQAPPARPPPAIGGVKPAPSGTAAEAAEGEAPASEEDEPAPAAPLPCARPVAPAGGARGAAVPPLRLEPVATGLREPIALVGHPSDPSTLFVLERPGVVVRLDQGAPATFLDLRERVATEHLEQGLLGLAFHPRFDENGLLFLTYTPAQHGREPSPTHPDRQMPWEYAHALSLVSLRVAPDAAEASWDDAVELMEIRKPEPHHNAGALAFGPDCMLYLSVGDGGAGDRAPENDTLLGKLLRLLVDDEGLVGAPADNPFAGGGGHELVWQKGLRNPWTFSFDHATGDLWVADVGGDSTGEVNHLPAPIPAAQHLGWPHLDALTQRSARNLTLEDYWLPVHEYGRDGEESANCAIIGGHVYRGAAIPALQGSYVFGDFCSGIVWRLWLDDAGEPQVEELLRTGGMPSGFGEDAAGELYVVDWKNGTVGRLQADG